MIGETVQAFVQHWGTHFPGADPPFALYYTDDDRYEEFLLPQSGFSCMIAQLARVLNGRTVSFTQETIGCGGGLRYCGFPVEPNPDLRYFLTKGVPGGRAGLRLKRCPELVDESELTLPRIPAEGRYLVARRIDKLEHGEEPQVVVWFSPPDVISALVTLAGFSTSDRHCVISPQSAGCGSIVSYPLAERGRPEPRAVLGMFDISARPYLKRENLSFAVPVAKFVEMARVMGESFLITESWSRIRGR